jgi:putative ATP-binding cassette transporter
MHVTKVGSTSASCHKASQRETFHGVIALLVVFAICALGAIAMDAPPRPLPADVPLSVFSAERAARHLANISRAPHPINSAEHNAVRDYLLEVLRQQGFAPEVQRTASVNERYKVPGVIENILCRMKGSTAGKAVLLVAHYDSVPVSPGASDDGAAVAALLESTRVLQALPQLKRDVIFLFSDGEERGLLGARAFVGEHPWARDVGFVLNFEARGNSGPSIMFQTSDQNGWLIRNFGQAASHPVANSLSYEIYKRLPNDTDLTVFRRAGFSGLNFAFIHGLAYYHTSLDAIQNLDLGSLQHHGDYLVEVTTQLGNTVSDDPRTANVIYFDVLGKLLVRYGAGAATLFLVLTTCLVALAAYLGIRRKLLKPGSCAAGVILVILGVIITVFVAWGTSWITLVARIPAVRSGMIYHPGWFISAFSAIGISCGALFYWAVARRIGAENLAAASLLAWLGLTIAVSIYFPGGSYILLWPLLFSACGWLVVFAGGQMRANAKTALLAASCTPAIIVVMPMAHKIFFAFAARSTLMVNALVGLTLSLLIGPITAELPSHWRTLDRVKSKTNARAGRSVQPTKIIAFFLEYSRKAVVLSMIAGIFSGACSAALLAVINTGLKNNINPRLLWIFGGLCVLLPVARFTSEVLLTRLGQQAMYACRMKLCHQVLAAPLAHLERLGPARLLTTLTEDIPNITGAVTVIPTVCVNVALVVGCLIYMAFLSWLLFAIVLGFLIIGIATYQIPILKIQKLFRLARRDADGLIGHLRGLIHGIKELKIHRGRRQAFVEEQFQPTADSLMRNNISAFKMYAGAASWGQTLVFVVIGLYLFFFSAISHLNLATMTGYTLALLYVMTPLQVIMNTLPQLGRANVALQTVQNLGFTLEMDKSEEFGIADPPAQQRGTLELKSVAHTYTVEKESGNFVLGPVNLTIRPGEITFIIGGNGSGKTTLVKLITGLYRAQEGDIYLDQQKVDDGTLDSYRQHFSVVFSDFYLFEQLLGLAHPETERKAREYLAQLLLSSKVQISNGKFSTTELSQGQRKRLALLVAFLEDRPIYVFDEWAADQDPYFKNIFYTRLLSELKGKGKTVIVISHDDRYYHVADRLIKLEEGRIVSDTTDAAAALEMVHGRLPV